MQAIALPFQSSAQQHLGHAWGVAESYILSRFTTWPGIRQPMIKNEWAAGRARPRRYPGAYSSRLSRSSIRPSSSRILSRT